MTCKCRICINFCCRFVPEDAFENTRSSAHDKGDQVGDASKSGEASKDQKGSTAKHSNEL